MLQKTLGQVTTASLTFRNVMVNNSCVSLSLFKPKMQLDIGPA